MQNNEHINNQHFFDSLPIGLLYLSHELTVEKINKFMGEIFSIDHNTAVGKNWLDLVPYMQQRKHLYDEALAGKKFFFPNTKINVNGQQRNFEVHYIPVTEKEKPKLLVVGKEITSEVLKHYQTAEDEREFRDLFMNAPTGYLIVKADGTIKAVNKKLQKGLGFNEEEIVGSKIFDLYADTEYGKPKAKQIFQRFVKGEIVAEEEVQLQKKSGELMWVSVSVIPVMDENGNIKESRSSMVDITKRKQAEKELHKTKAFLQSIIQNIPHMVFVKDAKDLSFVKFNKAGEELIGLTEQELIGKTDYDFFPEQEADFFVKKDKEVLEKQKMLEIARETLETKKGQRILRTKKIPIVNEQGESRYLLGISEDITEKEKLRNEMKKYASMQNPVLLEDDKSNNSLAILSIDQMQKKINEVINEHKNIPGLYLSLNKSHRQVSKQLAEVGINTKKLFFIDCIDKQSSDDAMSIAPGQIERLYEIIDQFLTEINNEKFVIIDSLSLLLIDNLESKVKSFMMNILDQALYHQAKVYVFDTHNTAFMQEISPMFGRLIK